MEELTIGGQTKADELREVIDVLKEEAPDNWRDLLLNLVKVVI